jgi:hypothetical protein
MTQFHSIGNLNVIEGGWVKKVKTSNELKFHSILVTMVVFLGDEG